MGSLWLVACTEGCLSQTDRGTEVQRQGATCPEPQVPRPQGRAQIHQRHRVPGALTWAWPEPGSTVTSHVWSPGPRSPSWRPTRPPPPQFQSLPLAEEGLVGTRDGLAALRDPGPSTLGVLHPTSGLLLLVQPRRPRAGPAGEATQVHRGRKHTAHGSGLGESPAGPPPGLSSWARTEGRVGAHSLHRLVWG